MSSIERMLEAEKISYAGLLEKFRVAFQEEVSCCFFLTTEKNTSGRVIFENGEIIYFGYANKRGDEAMLLLSTVKTLNYRIGGLRTYSRADMTLPDTASILDSLSGSVVASSPDVSDAVRPVGGLSEEERKAVEAVLIDMIGPMANFFIEDYVDTASSLKEAITNIITELPSEDVSVFKSALQKKLH